MKIKYIAIHDHDPDSGISKKMFSQVNALRASGIEAELIFLSREGFDNKIDASFVKYVDCPVPPYKGLLDKIKSNYGIKESYERLFSTLEIDDVVYLRNQIPTPWFHNLMKRTKNKIIIEVASNKYSEALMRKSYLYYLCLKIYNDKIFNSIDGVVSVTRDLVEKSYSKKVKTPFVVIGNGINMEKIPVRHERINSSNLITLTCVANVCKWHGLDRLIRGMKLYTDSSTKTYSFHLNIVGGGAEVPMLKKMAIDLEIEKQVTFHGFKKGSDLDAIIELTDIGIANLATFRKKIEYTSPLKSREYCARGLPFVYTCIDEDFPATFPFAKQFKSEELPIDMNEVIDFYEGLKLLNGTPAKMRKYAEDNLTWDSKMLKVLDLLTVSGKILPGHANC